MGVVFAMDYPSPCLPHGEAIGGFRIPHPVVRDVADALRSGGVAEGRDENMNTRQFPLLVGLATAAIGTIAGATLKPVEAKFQEPAPIKRPVVVAITPANRLQTPKAHWGIYAQAEYRYTESGKMSTVKRNDLIVEEDMYLGQGGNRSTVSLNSGEYEIHIQPDKSRRIVKKFIVNNLSNAPVGLTFNIPVIEDDAERNKMELVRIGPSLEDMDARLKALEKRAGIAMP
jgi:hypothetical protein